MTFEAIESCPTCGYVDLHDAEWRPERTVTAPYLRAATPPAMALWLVEDGTAYSLAMPPAHVAVSRIDLVIATDVGGYEVVPGPPSAAPIGPMTPSGCRYVIARVRIHAAAATITDMCIDNLLGESRVVPPVWLRGCRECGARWTEAE
ncbi:MAG TPA: hypothetical protein VK631_21975 [Solirubrobacteraceae bacterium]|nr:hypothetical protein [Solirubrobacteraceae bacterium]